MPRRSRAEARAGAHALPRKYTKAFTERAREPQHGGIDTGLFCPMRLHTRICASYGEASHSTKVFSTSGKIPGRIPGKRGFFGEIFPGFFLDGYIPGTIPGKMPRFQSATVVLDSKECDDYHRRRVRWLPLGFETPSAPRIPAVTSMSKRPLASAGI